MNSNISGFYKLSVDKRVKLIEKEANLSKEESELLAKFSTLGKETTNRMIENVVSSFPLPFAIALNFKVNSKDVLIPMAIEESSVVAACSLTAKLTRETGGFTAFSDEPIMIGEIFLFDIKDTKTAIQNIENSKKYLIEKSKKFDPILVNLGGGLKDIQIKELSKENALCIHLLIDCRDAMGANAVNTYCEKLSSYFEELSKGRAVLKILSNLTVHRTTTAKAVWSYKELEKSFKGKIKGEKIVKRILEVYECAAIDPFRAVTNNKGIMNGIDAVVIATGNDFRAIESGAHAYASLTGTYKPLTSYKEVKEGIEGTIKIPLALGVIGGATKIHPTAQLSLKLLQTSSAKKLANVIASVGLAQNFAALRALAIEGIQKGHMKLHAENIAIQAGASKDEIKRIAKQMIQEGNVNQNRAQELMGEK